MSLWVHLMIVYPIIAVINSRYWKILHTEIFLPTELISSAEQCNLHAQFHFILCLESSSTYKGVTQNDL